MILVETNEIKALYAMEKRSDYFAEGMGLGNQGRNILIFGR